MSLTRSQTKSSCWLPSYHQGPDEANASHSFRDAHSLDRTLPASTKNTLGLHVLQQSAQHHCLTLERAASLGAIEQAFPEAFQASHQNGEGILSLGIDRACMAKTLTQEAIKGFQQHIPISSGDMGSPRAETGLMLVRMAVEVTAVNTSSIRKTDAIHNQRTESLL